MSRYYWGWGNGAVCYSACIMSKLMLFQDTYDPKDAKYDNTLTLQTQPIYMLDFSE